MSVKKAHPEADDPRGDAAAADGHDLAERESRWNNALVGSGLGVWDHNYRLGRKYYSPTWKTMRGMTPDEEVAGDYDAWLQLVHPDDRDFIAHAIDRQNAGDPDYQIFEYRERHRDGRWIWIECRGACVEWDEAGVPTRIVGTDTDITDRKQAEETLSRLSRRLDLALEISRIGVFEADLEEDMVEWDDRLIAIYGLKGAARRIAGDAWAKSLHPDDRERVLGLADRSVESGSDFQQEYRIIRGDGVERVIRARSAFFIDVNGHRKLIGANWDVTEEVKLRDELRRAKDLAEARNLELEAAKESIEHLALHDYLTDLPNRRYLDKMLDDRSAECRAKGLGLAVLHIDLDRFKQINDTLGHRAGDAMLKHAAGVLRNSVRAADFVARIGGDEFVILCAVDPGSKKIGSLAERVIRELRKPVRFEGHDCRFGASIGIAFDSGPKLDAKQILLDADIALYRAKGLGRNRYEFFSASDRRDVVSAKQLADEILIGLERNEFVPFYQLQFDARTLDVAGVETLARWQHPVHGLLAPDRFLDIAEDLDVVSTIDALILERALADRSAWIKDGLPVPKISVNVSARRLADPDLGKKLRALKIPPGTISFELLESISLDDCDDAVAANLKKLRKLGIDIQIDDFGTGHASIVSLLRLSPKTLKIDRELIRMLPQSAEQRKLVGSIIDIGRSLDILVIAEGVETADHIRILEELDCDMLQGYALARPMPAMQIPSFIRAGSWRHGEAAARALQTQLRRALRSRAAK
ncbi:EAL domain-containing protein [Rhizobium sp. Pop5]|uniref:putative bifunctional diguanylate cyclase/phosphodiesterase n=1 Tax=Rhizobium sp. Pop5 TaxID=1223565 RepID=UPI000283CBFA|nr:EAL domain-containing protein [Rhizobium sp. Pop5]EJZ21729.1 PAS/PAC sensor-containing diguanylate cyclase/phosphodiesterase [Rhizobium sp. Pop5]UVD58707.1 EAL domain-containing protein [Rhizobium sp. Pop5]